MSGSKAKTLMDEEHRDDATIEYGVYRRVRTRPTYIYQLFGRIRLPQPILIPTLLVALLVGAVLLVIWLTLPTNMTAIMLPIFVFITGLVAVAFEKLHWDGRRADRWLAAVLRWCFSAHEYVRFKPVAKAPPGSSFANPPFPRHSFFSGRSRAPARGAPTGWKTRSRPVSPLRLIPRKKKRLLHVRIWRRR